MASSTGMFHQTWEAGEKKAVREHSLLVADRNRLWRYISPGGDDERGWQKVGRAIRAVSRMSLSLRASVSHVRAEGEPVVEDVEEEEEEEEDVEEASTLDDFGKSLYSMAISYVLLGVSFTSSYI